MIARRDCFFHGTLRRWKNLKPRNETRRDYMGSANLLSSRDDVIASHGMRALAKING
jgi:hypothetical protein